MAYDLVIRGGTVVDGSGLPGYRADVGIIGDKIATIGNLAGQPSKATIDAEGHVVSPGLIDGHTHMDAQIFWDPLGTWSCWHGVTSVVMGNCGFSLAPCGEAEKALVVRNLERSEDIPAAAMEAGIKWSWETFPQFLTTVEALPKGLNYACYVGHSALRSFVMGDRAFTEKANSNDLAAMKRELKAALAAGGMGLSTSRFRGHKTPEGLPVASRLADWSEVEQLVNVMSEAGAGVFEIAREAEDHDPQKLKAEQARLRDLAVKTGVPITFGSSWYHHDTPDVWRTQFAMVDETVAAGGRMLVQGTANWNGSLRSFETLMLYDRAPVWREFRKQPLAEQEKGFRDPEMRRKLIEAANAYTVSKDPTAPNALQREIDWNWIFPYDKPLPPYRSIAQISRERGISEIETVIDLALEKHLKLFIINPNSNQDQDFVLAMIRHPHTAVTFSDSGAHVASVLNPVQTHLLGYWVRERQAVTLEAAVRKITFDLAAFWRLKGRGLLREGYMADVVVFDPKTIAPGMPELLRDLPTGAERLSMRATGIAATVINGAVYMRDGAHTGTLPGRLMRGTDYVH
jgi:N-acyl-D-aspartate/D-glutamate deacylase